MSAIKQSYRVQCIDKMHRVYEQFDIYCLKIIYNIKHT